MSMLLCEPQCRSFEHAAFNAALLATVGAAFPEEELVFFGEQSHLREVENILVASHAMPLRVSWRRAEIPPSKPGGLRRLRAERQFIQTVLSHAESTSADNVLFCSATEITILALKQILRSNPAACGVHVVLHGVLRSLLEPRWRKPWRWGFSLRQALHFRHPPQLGYIALSESIRAHAVRAAPRLSRHLHALDMPRLWSPTVTPAEREAPQVRFGFFGSTAKGFAAFYETARASKSKNLAASFSLIGFLNGRDLQRDYDENIVGGLSRAPLSQAEYSRRAALIEYAVWPANPAHYSLTASASFLDALDFLKPIIYLANPYIDSYFEKLGDIGYRCQTLEEMQNVIEQLARAFPNQRYQAQCAAILKSRARFEPATLAPSLQRILAGELL